MSESIQWISALQRILKSQKKTYRDLAPVLQLSESSVKRLFSTKRISLDQVAQISQALGYTLEELSQEVARARHQILTLTETQEREVIADPKLMVVAVCTLNHWTMEDILFQYQLTPQECLQAFLRLDALSLIQLLPGNRIRLNVARDFHWRAGGPIQDYFQKQGLPDFLNNSFLESGESRDFTHGMLTESAIIQLQEELLKLRKTFAELHEQSLSSPLSQRRGVGLLWAERPWEPTAFKSLRR